MNNAEIEIRIQLTDIEGYGTQSYGNTIAVATFDIPSGLPTTLLAGYASVVIETASRNLRDLVQTQSLVERIERLTGREPKAEGDGTEPDAPAPGEASVDEPYPAREYDVP